MKKLLAALLALGLALLALPGCTGLTPAPAGLGNLRLMLTDAPARPEVTSVIVTLAGVQIHRAEAARTGTAPTTTTTTGATTTATGLAANLSARPVAQGQGKGKAETATQTTTATATTTTATEDEEDETGGTWLTIPLHGEATFDLLQLQGVQELLALETLSAGHYTQILLDIAKVEVSLNNGPLTPATLPSGTLKFTGAFDIAPGETTTIVIDIDAAQSVHVTGNDRVMVRPVVKLSVSRAASPELTTVSGTLGAVDVTQATVTVQPAGEGAQPLVLKVTPQTAISVNGAAVTLAGLTIIPAGAPVSASYYQNSLQAAALTLTLPASTTTATTTATA